MSRNNSSDWPNNLRPVSPWLFTPATKPRELVWSQGLLFLGGLLAFWALLSSSQLINDSPISFLGLPSDISRTELSAKQDQAYTRYIVHFGIVAFLWTRVALYTRHGATEARIFSSLLAALTVISLGVKLFNWHPGPGSTVHIINTFLGLVAAALHYTPNARTFYGD